MKKFLLLAGLMFATAVNCWGQPVVRQLLNNGSISNRITLVFLAEGFTSNQFDSFITNASNVMNGFLATAPFADYRTCFNAYAIFVASNESGSDHPASGIYKDTYFNSSYDTYGYYYSTSIPPNDRNQNYADGQGKVDALLDLVPDHDIPIMIINDPAYGGSGGRLPMCSVAIASREIAIHETGHSFAGLGDEYTAPYPGFPIYDEPNTTQETQRERIKWNVWIDPGTPIPTTDPFGSPVGLFEGARYFTSGWYRPQWDCKMRTLGAPFCVVCSEALVKNIYKRIRPIDASTPATNAVYSLARDASLSFSVSPLPLPRASLHVQWQLNGVPLSGETNSTFVLKGPALAAATNTVKALIHDATPLVRNDPQGLLNDSETWVVVATSALPRLSAALNSSLTVSYPATATNFVLQSASTIEPGASWQDVGVRPTSSNGQNIVALPRNATQRYFRLSSTNASQP